VRSGNAMSRDEDPPQPEAAEAPFPRCCGRREFTNRVRSRRGREGEPRGPHFGHALSAKMCAFSGSVAGREIPLRAEDADRDVDGQRDHYSVQRPRQRSGLPIIPQRKIPKAQDRTCAPRPRCVTIAAHMGNRQDRAERPRAGLINQKRGLYAVENPNVVVDGVRIGRRLCRTSSVEDIR